MEFLKPRMSVHEFVGVRFRGVNWVTIFGIVQLETFDPIFAQSSDPFDTLWRRNTQIFPSNSD